MAHLKITIRSFIPLIFSIRAVRGSLAETPELVMEFLTKLSNEIKPDAENEFKEMGKMKKEFGKSSRVIVFILLTWLDFAASKY